MKNAFTVFAMLVAIVVLLGACNISSDPGRVDYGPFTTIVRGDIPSPVLKSIGEAEVESTVTEVRRFGVSPNNWFEVEFSDGRTRKFQLDGEEMFFGVL